jgi:hypothetical protein
MSTFWNMRAIHILMNPSMNPSVVHRQPSYTLHASNTALKDLV